MATEPRQVIEDGQLAEALLARAERILGPRALGGVDSGGGDL